MESKSAMAVLLHCVVLSVVPEALAANADIRMRTKGSAVASVDAVGGTNLDNGAAVIAHDAHGLMRNKIDQNDGELGDEGPGRKKRKENSVNDYMNELVMEEVAQGDCNICGSGPATLNRWQIAGQHEGEDYTCDNAQSWANKHWSKNEKSCKQWQEGWSVYPGWVSKCCVGLCKICGSDVLTPTQGDCKNHQTWAQVEMVTHGLSETALSTKCNNYQKGDWGTKCCS